MILEGIVTTLNEDGGVNISPMGPWFGDEVDRFQLRPFPTSRTWLNLERTRQGVFHVTDNVEMLAQAAVGRVDPAPAMHPAQEVTGFVLDDACRWYAFRVARIGRDQPRLEVDCRIVAEGRQRDFFGFNRGKHAVVEAAILATRIHLLPAPEIQDELQRLAVIVGKTGGPAERRALDFLRTYVSQSTADQFPP